MNNSTLRLFKRSSVAACSIFFTGYFYSSTALAASCCGGGASGGVILPKFNQAMWDIGYSQESYEGYWDQQGQHKSDPVGSDLNQISLNLSYAQRLNDDWQVSGFVPLIHNQNQYSGEQSNVYGLGDSQVSLWYETFENVTCVYKINSWQSLKPAVYFGASLTFPTGISNYGDRVSSSQDITGRGFYRLDANMLIEKTVYPFSVAWQASYGQHLERPINEESGKAVNAYDKKLGDRTSHTISAAYTWFLPSLAMLNATVSHGTLKEGKTTNDGITDSASGLEKQSLAFNLSYSSTVRDWILKIGVSQAQTGQKIPKTTVTNIGISHVY